MTPTLPSLLRPAVVRLRPSASDREIERVTQTIASSIAKSAERAQPLAYTEALSLLRQALPPESWPASGVLITIGRARTQVRDRGGIGRLMQSPGDGIKLALASPVRLRKVLFSMFQEKGALARVVSIEVQLNEFSGRLWAGKQIGALSILRNDGDPIVVPIQIGHDQVVPDVTVKLTDTKVRIALAGQRRRIIR